MRRLTVLCLATLVLGAGCSGADGDAGDPTRSPAPPPSRTLGAPPLDPGSPLLTDLLVAAMPTPAALLDATGGTELVREPLLEVLPPTPLPDPCDPLQEAAFASGGGYDAERTGRVTAETSDWVLSSVASVWHYPSAEDAAAVFDAAQARLETCTDSVDSGVSRLFEPAPDLGLVVLDGWTWRLETPGPNGRARQLRTGRYDLYVRERLLYRVGAVTVGDGAPELERRALVNGLRNRVARPERLLAEAEVGTAPA